MSVVLRGIGWIVLYVAVAVVPLAFAVVGPVGGGRGFWVEFSVALGFVGMSMLGAQFALVARFRAVAAPFGEDALVQFHRQISYVALAFILAHPVLLQAGGVDIVALLNLAEAPWRARCAIASTVLLLIVIATSVWRQRLRIRYEVWQLIHGGLSVAVVALALAHMLLVGYYLDATWKVWLWIVMTVALVGLLVWVRVLAPLRRLRRPWRVAKVTAERGDAHTLTLVPDGHHGFPFAPGQFGWLTVDRSPFAVTAHPFSFSSSAEDTGQIAITIKALGDFTATVGDITPGTRAFLDGPHGVFTPDRHEGPGFVLIAGGVGITPAMSILRTMADRGDRRPFLLLYAVRNLDEQTFDEEIAGLTSLLDLTTVLVPQNPPPDWDGESGFIDRALLQRHLPARYRHHQYFICGPAPMVTAIEDALAAADVPADRVHTERFTFV
ncbi:ferric reductase-like transmembrane domain-containing protein [Nocardia cyriacigeorgica]|uniref:ferredoxin reductase family protein n=1 Tax=Nocardia cyriacigeorgica TaxID=135487 RepID=UPI0018936E0C|nr:ferric reductase-like transmembrane domain-containing protein [Nocardia cyriacigeorgica]MBF6454647.1 ferric reductase-like transmembrane domain-containing protein [Nocardia cyriacigeorgica]MBF6481639.1 ferric reductase-like transmembrane domain-containing protein [Nocardia cyriacigeorgica]MBF6552541.1 ferric reductase-like transmembrane domain-containing protein [Nocardia cyriacigeorgica]